MDTTRTSLRSGLRALLATSVLGGLLLVAAAPATAAPRPADTPVLDAATVLAGDVPGVTASAKGGFGLGNGDLRIQLDVVNTSGAPVRVKLPRAALFATDDETNQTATISGLIGETAAKASTDPVLDVPVGRAAFAVRGFCGQHDDQGPTGVVPMHWVGVAEAPLPRIMANIVYAQADDDTAQAAVWWATDEQTPTVADARVRGLLTGVDVPGLAANHVRVIPDAHYQPSYLEVEPYGALQLPNQQAPSLDGVSSQGPLARTGGGAPTLLIGLVIAALVAIGLTVVFFQARSSRPTRSTVRAGMPAAWYPDPNGSGRLRWWDGRSWTDRLH